MAVVGETSKDARSPMFPLKSFGGRRVAGSVVLGIAGRYGEECQRNYKNDLSVQCLSVKKNETISL